MNAFARGAMGAAMLLAPVVSLPATANEIGPSFFEDFDSPQLDTKLWYISDGWSNGAHQLCTWSKENLKLSDGNLLFILDRTPRAGRDYSCAELQTNKFYGYGVYEIRMRPVAGAGMVSALFTYTGPQHGTQHDEIDFEFLGRKPNSVQLNHFVNAKGNNEHMVDLGGDATKTFRDYAFEWAPDALRWYVDGRLVREVTSANSTIPTTPSKVIMSLWNGDIEAWLGRFDPANAPLTMAVDWVAFTAAGEGCRFPASVVCRRQGQAKP